MCRVDMSYFDSIDINAALAVVSEVGADMSRLPTVKRLTSWLTDDVRTTKSDIESAYFRRFHCVPPGPVCRWSPTTLSKN